MPGSTSGPTTRWLPTRSSVGIWAGAQEVDGGGSGREADLVGSGIRQRLDPPALDPTPRRGVDARGADRAGYHSQADRDSHQHPYGQAAISSHPATPSRGLGPPLGWDSAFSPS